MLSVTRYGCQGVCYGFPDPPRLFSSAPALKGRATQSIFVPEPGTGRGPSISAPAQSGRPPAGLSQAALLFLFYGCDTGVRLVCEDLHSGQAPSPAPLRAFIGAGALRRPFTGAGAFARSVSGGLTDAPLFAAQALWRASGPPKAAPLARGGGSVSDRRAGALLRLKGILY